jgi:hypothetical protein
MIDEPRPATGTGYWKPSQPTHRVLRFFLHRARSPTHLVLCHNSEEKRKAFIGIICKFVEIYLIRDLAGVPALNKSGFHRQRVIVYAGTDRIKPVPQT